MKEREGNKEEEKNSGRIEKMVRVKRQRKRNEGDRKKEGWKDIGQKKEWQRNGKLGREERGDGEEKRCN